MRFQRISCQDSSSGAARRSWRAKVPSTGNCHVAYGRVVRRSWLTVVFSIRLTKPRLPQIQKINRSMPIVAETVQIPNGRNSPLKSRARNFDGSGRRFFIGREKTFSVISMRYSLSKQSSGSEWSKTTRFCGRKIQFSPQSRWWRCGG